MSIDEIVAKIIAVSKSPLPEMAANAASQFEQTSEPAQHVVLTGGEPMLPRGVTELCSAIKDSDFHITIETAGTIERDLACDLMSISPKLANSTPTTEHVGAKRAGEWSTKHERTRHRPDVVNSLIREREYQIKFVVEKENDLEEIELYLDQLHLDNAQPVDRRRVLLMPEGIDSKTLQRRTDWLKPLCESKGFLFCPRLHIQWYGNRRAT